MLDIFTTAQEDSLAQSDRNAAAAPKVGVMPTFGEAYASAREENLRYDDLFAQGRNEYDYVQQHLDHYTGQTGETLPNPMQPRGAGSAAASLAFVRQKFVDKARTMDDPNLSFPSDDEIRAGGVALGRQARRNAAQAEQGPSGPGAMFGGLAAGLVSSTTDPLNAISLALAPEGGSLLMAALKVGGGFMAQQATTEALTYGYQKEVNPEHTVGEAIGSVFEAGVAGALQEAGLRGLGAGWRKLRGTRPGIAAAMPLEVRDAGAVAEKAEDLVAQNPFKGFSGDAAHHEAVAKVEADLLAGNKVELPQAAVDEAAAKRGQVFYPGGSISARYNLAELSELVTSHDRDFNINPTYPAELQPRDRAGTPAREQVQSIYSNLEPERLGPSPEANAGAPIVGPDGVVESGNGRVLALQKAYEDERGAKYRSWLESQGYDTSGYKQPALVAVRETAMSAEERANFAHAANGSVSLRLNAVEQGLSDARGLTGEVLDLLKNRDLNAAANRDFARAFVARLPQGERGGLLTREGGLSANGLRRMQAALAARAYGDPSVLSRAFDHPDPNIKSIAGALTDASGEWARMRDAATRGDIAAAHDVTDDVMQAVKSVMRARDEKRPLFEVMNQGDMFQSDTSQLAARLFFKDEAMTRPESRPKIADNLETYAREAQKNTVGDRLFADDVAPADILRRGMAPDPARLGEILSDGTGIVGFNALNGRVRLRDGREIPVSQGAGTIWGPNHTEISPRLVAEFQNDKGGPWVPTKAVKQPPLLELAEPQIDKVMTDPKVQEAAGAELQRMMERGDNQFVKPDGTKGVIDAELHEIDQSLAAAKEISVCTNYGVAAE